MVEGHIAKNKRLQSIIMIERRGSFEYRMATLHKFTSALVESNTVDVSLSCAPTESLGGSCGVRPAPNNWVTDNLTFHHVFNKSPTRYVTE